MTQHNAALVQETNSAIEQAEGQASELHRIVEVFVMEDDDTIRQRSEGCDTSADMPRPMYDRPWPRERRPAAA